MQPNDDWIFKSRIILTKLQYKYYCSVFLPSHWLENNQWYLRALLVDTESWSKSINDLKGPKYESHIRTT